MMIPNCFTRLAPFTTSGLRSAHLVAGLAAGLLVAPLSAQLPLANPGGAQAGQDDPNRVVATVDGRDVTRAEVQQILDTAPPQLAQFFQTDPQGALMQWFIVKHLGQEGDARNLDEISPLKEQIEAMRLDILAGAVLSDERNGYQVTSQMIDDYYQFHQAEYAAADISAIFISFKPQISRTGTSAEELQQAALEALAASQAQRTEVQAQTLAAEIVAQLRDGADFAELVAKYSDDPPSKAKGGAFGTITLRSAYPENFRREVLELNTGAIGDPIRLATGFYIVRVDEKHMQPVADVRGDIIDQIRQQHLDQWMRDLNMRFTPEVKDVGFFTNPGAKQQQQPGAFSPIP